jgi:hypothetical protein
MSRNGFVMVMLDPATGSVEATARFPRKPAVSSPHLDSQCPLFGDKVQPNKLRIIRTAPPPVVWVNDQGEARDIFHRAPWPLHIHNPKPGIWATEFLDPAHPDGRLHLRLVRPLHTDREMIQAAWKLPENGAQPFPGEESEYQHLYEQERQALSMEFRGSGKGRRKDLRNKTVFTIDNDDSMDLDDALDIFSLAEDHYIVGIHIADVTAFVKFDSSRDKDARRRGTSHYFEDMVLHMLPHCLSTDLCSLTPNREKPAVSIYFEIVLEQGRAVIKGSRVFNSVIRSRRQLTYSEADRALAGQTTDIPSDVLQSLKEAVSIGCFLRAGRPENLSEPNDHGVSGAMIEDFMVTANQLVGEQMAGTLGTLKNARKRCLFRSHPGPSVKDLMTLAERLAVIDLMAPFDPEELLDAARSRRKTEFPDRSGKESGAFMSAALHREIRFRLRMGSDEAASQLKTLESGPGGLKIWKSARLNDLFNFSGHHGLGISRYAWFTSPIRRYPDMVNHRFLKNAIAGNFSGKHPGRVDQEAMHRLIADGKVAQRAYHRRRDFHLLFGSMDGTLKKISVTPLNFRWLGPYTFTVEAEVDGFTVVIQIRDPEHAHIEAHGLQCRVDPVGEPGFILRVGQPTWLRLHPASGDISLQAGCLLVKTSQWNMKI